MLVGGCGSPPKDQFYTLAPPATAPAVAAAAARYAVAVGPVKLPEAVDRPQLVLREGGSRVRILEEHRWAGPLREEIARSVAASLARQLPDAQITTEGNHALRPGEFQVRIDIERFEATSDNGVTVQGVWTLRSTGAAAASRPFTASETAAGGSYDAIVSAYTRALAALSAQIGAEIRMRQGQPAS
jgi:uncharacterized lipoprotein YmbA